MGGSTRLPEADASAVLAALGEPLLVCDAGDEVDFVNAAASRLLDYDRTDLVGRKFDVIVPERLRGEPLYRALLRSPARTGRSPVLRRDGVEIEVEMVVEAIRPGAADERVVVWMRPVAESVGFDETHRLVFENAPLGIFHFDSRGLITACNDYFVRIIGSSKRVLIGLDMTTLPDQGIVRSLRTALGGTRTQYEGDYQAATSGKVTPVRVSFAPIHGDHGAVVGGVGIVEDTTERKEMAGRLAQADRMASVGTLAAGVAHEINNPLAYALGSLELCARELRHMQLALGEDTQHGDTLRTMEECVVHAREGAERVRVIVRDLMTFSRARSESPAPVDIEPVLDASVNLAWNEIRHRARLVKIYARVSPVLGDEARLGQVFVNLLVNAAQAIPEGDATSSEISVRTFEQGDHVVVEIADTGLGIPPDTLSRVFEPFYTTKPIGVGTGLGLAICHGIVSSLGGTITVESTPGKGSTFRVALPAARESSNPPPRLDVPVSAPTTASRILIIDDEPLLGQTLKLAFQGRHDVVVATSGREGLARLAEDAGYDLLLCDLMMPDISGIAVFEQVMRDHPALQPRFVFMTGGAFTDRARHFLDNYEGQRLEKPFDIRDIEVMIAALPPR